MKDSDVNLYTLDDVGIEESEFLTVAAKHSFDVDFGTNQWISVAIREQAEVIQT